MQTFTVAAFFSLIAFAAATPLAPRATCNTTPSAATNNGNNVQAIATPSANTAAACQQQCEANNQCQSFVFGLAPNSNTPTCKLFAVPASQVPSQGTDLNVFDKACSGVPSQAPTRANPIGQ